jgi:putative endopeptidase
LKTLDWMDDPTRAEALKKLGNFEVRVGYPNKWRDYSALQIDKAKLFENVMARASSSGTARSLVSISRSTAKSGA